MKNLQYIYDLLNITQWQAFQEYYGGRSLIVLIQEPPETSKSLTLMMIAISFAILRGLKCVIAMP
jgi:hypothetical protein